MIEIWEYKILFMEHLIFSYVFTFGKKKKSLLMKVINKYIHTYIYIYIHSHSRMYIIIYIYIYSNTHTYIIIKLYK